MQADLQRSSPAPAKGVAEFTLTAITNDAATMRAADAAGVNRIGIDIERLGKPERQRLMINSRVSDHELSDLAIVAANVRRAEVFVRLNPMHGELRGEIERALALGAQALMLPYFSTEREVQAFVEMVAGRASAIPLIETATAAARVREIVAVPGVAEIFVGLNDLSTSLGLSNPFEVVPSELMKTIAHTVRDAGLCFGFGGLARVGDATLPVAPDLVFPQYPRLGASSAWLSRSFFRGIGPQEIAGEVCALRERLGYCAAQPASALLDKREELAQAVRRLRNH